MSRVLTLTELGHAAAEWRREGAVIVLAAGCFDFPHEGHIEHLKAARKLGNVLVVSVAGDDVIRRKRAGTVLPAPLIPAVHRAANIAQWRFVDAVVVCETKDTAPVIKALRPHVYAKGEEYRERITAALDAEGRALDRVGGRLEFVSGPVVCSSSALLAGV